MLTLWLRLSTSYSLSRTVMLIIWRHYTSYPLQQAICLPASSSYTSLSTAHTFSGTFYAMNSIYSLPAPTAPVIKNVLSGCLSHSLSLSVYRYMRYIFWTVTVQSTKLHSPRWRGGSEFWTWIINSLTPNTCQYISCS